MAEKMTKGKIKILEKCEKYNFSDKEIEYIKNSDRVLKELNSIFDYIWRCHQVLGEDISDERIISEIERCLEICRHTNVGIYKTYNISLLNYLLPAYHKDYLFESKKKNYFAEDWYLDNLNKIHSIKFENQDIEEIININKFDSYRLFNDINDILVYVNNKSNYQNLISDYLDCVRDLFETSQGKYIIKLPIDEFFINDYLLNKEQSFISYLINNRLSFNYKGYSSGLLSSYLDETDILDNMVKDKMLKIMKDTLKNGYCLEIDMGKLNHYKTESNPYHNIINECYGDEIKKIKENKTNNINIYTLSTLNKDLYIPVINAMPKKNITIDEPTDCLTIEYNNGHINLHFFSYSKAMILYQNVRDGVSYKHNPDDQYGYYISNTGYIEGFKIIIFNDGGMYQKHNNKLIPLSLKTLKYHSKRNTYVQRFVESILYKDNNKFLKDIYCDFIECNDWYIPCTINNLKKYHNKKEFILDNYKIASQLKTNYNNTNLNISYMIIKSVPYVTQDTINVLTNTKDIRCLDNVWGKTIKEKLVNYYLNVFMLRNDTEKIHNFSNIYVRDYIRLCMALKSKINLKYSYKRIVEEHDRMNNEVQGAEYLKSIGNVKVPKDTKFKKLRDCLPKEFEWIKTSKRLAAESGMQHHCVWQYGSEINNDVSAIYSFYDKNGDYSDIAGKKELRYTIEFGFKKYNDSLSNSSNKYTYYIKQIQRACNQGSCNKMKKYINSLLKVE